MEFTNQFANVCLALYGSYTYSGAFNIEEHNGGLIYLLLWNGYGHRALAVTTNVGEPGRTSCQNPDGKPAYSGLCASQSIMGLHINCGCGPRGMSTQCRYRLHTKLSNMFEGAAGTAKCPV